METIELNAIDTRLECTRLRDRATEKRLLSSIMEQDILEPVEVVGPGNGSMYILVDGFKRYRCARKLSKWIIPAQCIASDITGGLLSFLRRGMHKGVSAIEEAALIEELYKRCGMNIYNIALHIGRSPSWVSMRLNMLDGLSDMIRKKIMSGAFPARAYMYGIKGFTRVNKTPRNQVEAFVNATSGKGLSTRELFVLSRAFFKGGDGIEKLVLEGDIHNALRLVTGGVDSRTIPKGDKVEQLLIKNLETTLSSINFIIGNGVTLVMNNNEIINHVNYLTGIFLNSLPEFLKTIKELHDRTRPTTCRTDNVRAGSKPQSHSAAVAN